MPALFRARRHDPWWDLDGAGARRSRARRHLLGVLSVALGIALLALAASHLPAVDLQQVTSGSGRMVMLGSLLLLLASCTLVGVGRIRRGAPA